MWAVKQRDLRITELEQSCLCRYCSECALPVPFIIPLPNVFVCFEFSSAIMTIGGLVFFVYYSHLNLDK